MLVTKERCHSCRHQVHQLTIGNSRTSPTNLLRQAVCQSAPLLAMCVELLGFFIGSAACYKDIVLRLTTENSSSRRSVARVGRGLARICGDPAGNSTNESGTCAGMTAVKDKH